MKRKRGESVDRDIEREGERQADGKGRRERVSIGERTRKLIHTLVN